MATPASRPNLRHAPPVVVLMRRALRVAALVSPDLAAWWAHRLWLTPRGRPSSPREEQVLAESASGLLTVDGERVVTYAWGQGPTVLLVHGWSGRASQFATLGPALAAAGFHALAFDAPAHGASGGRRTNIFAIERVLRTLEMKHGPLHGVVGHSFGCVCLAYALRRGLGAQRAVCLAAPCQIDWMLQVFCDLLGLSPVVVGRLRERLARDAGGDYRRTLSADMNARFLDVPALVIHDDDDQDVPWRQGAMLARAWPGARFERTRGLGHRRIVRDTGIAQRVTAFLCGEGPVS